MIEFLPAVEQDILGNREIPQGHVKARRFPASAAPGRERLGFDHEQVEVGIGAGISARAGAEEDDRLRGCFANDGLDHLA